MTASCYGPTDSTIHITGIPADSIFELKVADNFHMSYSFDCSYEYLSLIGDQSGHKGVKFCGTHKADETLYSIFIKDTFAQLTARLYLYYSYYQANIDISYKGTVTITITAMWSCNV